jgi:hypothetical protein
MNNELVKLFGAVAALGAGIAAIVVVSLLVHGAV